MSPADSRSYDVRRRLLLQLFAGFYRCPTTGRILEALPGDDNVACGCGTSNPRCPREGAERSFTHRIAYLEAVSVDDYLQAGGPDGLCPVPGPEGDV